MPVNPPGSLPRLNLPMNAHRPSAGLKGRPVESRPEPIILEHDHCGTFTTLAAVSGVFGGALAGWVISRILDR